MVVAVVVAIVANAAQKLSYVQHVPVFFLFDTLPKAKPFAYICLRCVKIMKKKQM